MGEMRFGITFHPYPAAMPPAALAFEFASAAEELGFDSLWVGDHVLWRKPLLDPLTLLASMAARTKCVRLGTSVLLLPLRQPAVVAKMVASLDYLSGGRVTLGVGIGGENPKEYEVCGVPIAERGKRMDESIEILRCLWSKDEATFEGRYLSFEGVDLQPKPVQRPGPPIWIGGRSDAALRRVARLGDGWIDYFVTPQGFRECAAKIASYAEAAGRTSTPCWIHVMMINVASSKDAAKRSAEQYLSNYYDHAFRFLLARYCALGTAENCIAKINGYVEAGADQIILVPACDPSVLIGQMELLAREVVPAFRGRMAIHSG